MSSTNSNINKLIFLSFFKSVLLPIAIALLAFLFLPKAIVFFLPFLIGWFIAWLASPMVKFIEDRLKIHRKAGAAFVIAGSIILVVFIIYLAVSFLIEQSISFVKIAPSFLEEVSVALNKVKEYTSVFVSRLPEGVQMEITNSAGEAGTYIASLVSKGSSFLMGMASSAVKQAPMALLSTVVVILSAYFFVSKKKEIDLSYKTKCPQKVRSFILLITNGIRQAFGGYLLAQIKIELFVFICLLIGFLILKVPFAWLVAFGISILDFLPIFGTGTAIVPWAFVEAVNGDYLTAVALLAIWGLSQLLRQFLQPKFISNQVGLSEFATLFLLYAGFVFGGIVGMILSIPIGMVFVTLYQSGIFKPLISEWKNLAMLVKVKFSSY